MKLKFLYPYKNMQKYYDNIGKTQNAWEEIIVAPYWGQIAEWAGNSCDYMKPASVKDEKTIIRHVEIFETLDLSGFEAILNTISNALPIDDEDSMTVAFYPSENNMDEGVVGCCIWGNIIIMINPLVEDFQKWIPFVFAHEYHHCVLGHYWYCVKRGSETKGNFLEYLINEGQADEFAKSLYPDFQPSWHKGVTKEAEKSAWEKLRKVLYEVAPPQEQANYMFGNKELAIPPFAGYYFGSMIVNSFMKKYPDISFSELIKIPHQTIYNESSFYE